MLEYLSYLEVRKIRKYLHKTFQSLYSKKVTPKAARRMVDAYLAREYNFSRIKEFYYTPFKQQELDHLKKDLAYKLKKHKRFRYSSSRRNILLAMLNSLTILYKLPVEPISQIVIYKGKFLDINTYITEILEKDLTGQVIDMFFYLAKFYFKGVIRIDGYYIARRLNDREFVYKRAFRRELSKIESVGTESFITYLAGLYPTGNPVKARTGKKKVGKVFKEHKDSVPEDAFELPD